MKKFLTIAAIAAFCSLFFSACNEEVETDDLLNEKKSGVTVTFPRIEFDDVQTKGMVMGESEFGVHYADGEKINIWSDEGTLVLYTLNLATISDDGKSASFTGGGFTLTNDKTYYSVYPAQYNVESSATALPVDLTTQNQQGNDNTDHMMKAMLFHASATCEDGSTSFNYASGTSFIRMLLTVPEAITATGVTIVADSEVFYPTGSFNVTDGTFTPGEAQQEISFSLDNIDVAADGKLIVNMAIMPFAAASVQIKVSTSGGKLFVTEELSQTELVLGKARKIEATLTEDIVDPVAMIGMTKYPTLPAAVAAAKSGDEIIMMEDVENVGSLTLAAGVTLNGNSHKVSSNSSLRLGDGATVKDVNFENIHNDSSKLSAIYGSASATVTGCSFTDCDWDSIQFTPVAGSALTITGNTFAETDSDPNSVKAQRFIHIQSKTNVDFSATVTNNKMTGTTAQGKLECYYFTYQSKIDLSHNYLETPRTGDTGVCVLENDGANVGELIYPVYSDYALSVEYTPKVILKDTYTIRAEYDTTIQAAFNEAANDEVITVFEGEYSEVVDVKGGKTVTIAAKSGDDVKIAGLNHSSSSNPSTIVVKDITIDNALQTAGWFTGTSQNINPCVGAWGGYFTFEGCTFKVTGEDKAETGVMTWWASNLMSMYFYNCTFEPSDPSSARASEARAMQIYDNVNLIVDNCTFSTPKRYSLKYVGKEGTSATLTNNTVSGATSMVELGSSAYPGANYTVTFTGNTLDTGIEHYNIANAEGQTVYVDGVKVYPEDPDYEVDSDGNLSIYTAAGMEYFATSVNTTGTTYSGKTVTLMRDIDMTGVDWVPVGQTGGYGANAYFQGTFDGNGKTLSNLSITHWESGSNSGKYYASGLFGFIDMSSAVIKDLTVDHASVTGHHWVGVIVGYLTGSISGCTVTNSAVECTNANSGANGDKAGLITGYINSGTVSNCTGENSTVQAYRDAGQLVGASKPSYVTDCTATNVTVSRTTDSEGENIRNEIIGREL